MMKLILSILMLSQVVFAGNDQGGGGHPCKAEAMQLIKNIDDLYFKDSELSQNYPEWEKMRIATDPKLNPGFLFQVTDGPIENCPNTKSAFACSIPNKNLLQLNCGQDGWETLSPSEKYKQIIHELYWWTDIIDANYHYSIPFSQSVYKKINDNTNGKIFMSLGKGDIQSIKILESKTECALINQGSSQWIGSKCSSFTCNYVATSEFTLLINNEIRIPVQTLQKFTARYSRQIETYRDRCLSHAESNYQNSLKTWTDQIQAVQNGTTLKKSSKVTGNSNKHCYKKTLETFLNLKTKVALDTTFRSTQVECE